MIHFFDVGANTGQTFDDFLCQTNDFDGATVWCFEPSPRHLPGLMERAELVRDRFSVRICPFGLWNRTAIVHLWQKDDARGDSFEEALGKTANLKTGYEVHAAVFSAAGFIGDVTAEGDEISIKIDAEGAEYGILSDIKDCRSIIDRCKRIMVEWHSCSAMWEFPSRDDTEAAFRSLGHPLEQWEF